VINRLAEVDVSVELAETASRGYLRPPEPELERTYRTSVVSISAAVEQLATLTVANPVQRRQSLLH